MQRPLRLSLMTAAFAALAVSSAMSPAMADCTCRAQGRQFEQGQAACIATPNGLRVATCGMVLNNTSWDISQTPCLSTQALSRRRMAARIDHTH